MPHLYGCLHRQSQQSSQLIINLPFQEPHRSCYRILFPSLPSEILIPRAPIPRHILDPIIFQYLQHLIRQRPHDLDRIYPRRVAGQTLPLGDPGRLWVSDRDQGVEDGGGALGDGVGAVLQLEDRFAVRTPAAVEVVVGPNDGANHAGAHVARG